MLPGEVIGGNDSVHFQSHVASNREYSQAGTLEEWRAEVSAFCVGNPLPHTLGSGQRPGRPTVIVDRPLGRLLLTAENGAVRALDWVDNGNATPMTSAASEPVLALAALQLADWFAGRRRGFDLPLEPGGTAFQRRVWAALAAIPYGETRTYGQLAAALGSGPRAVGGACGRNPIPIIVPCHRVLAASGGEGGYSGFGGLATKRHLLEFERSRND
ncbi:methylated-DNA-(protein)-cysteine S-methyltransferase [uncultured Gammaproteobacteria bacterium]